RLIKVTTQRVVVDWIVYDEYTLDSKGEIAALYRKSNILPGSRSEEQTFRIERQMAKEESRLTLGLTTGKPYQGDVEKWLPQVKIVTATRRFPFSSLLTDTSVLKTRMVCKPKVDTHQ